MFVLVQCRVAGTAYHTKQYAVQIYFQLFFTSEYVDTINLAMIDLGCSLEKFLHRSFPVQYAASKPSTLLLPDLRLCMPVQMIDAQPQ